MGKLIYAMMASLDGFISGPDGELDWHLVDEVRIPGTGSFVYFTDTKGNIVGMLQPSAMSWE